MQVEFINQTNRFFPEVVALGKKHSATLGFMPDGGFDDHAKKQCMIIAHNDDELCGYLMFRKVPRYSRVSIVHLCIDEKFRGQRITEQLLNILRKKYIDQYAGISLSCRDDYQGASTVWLNYGFVSKGRVRSRSLEEHYLNKWWYDFNKPDLFSIAADNSTKVKALLDVNIIVKLRDSANDYNPFEDPRGLLADWLAAEAEFYFASETYNEINRDENLQRALRTRSFLGNFVEAKYDIESQKQVVKKLERIIRGCSDNDKSDRKQLATCIVSDIRYFITLDIGIIDKRDEIESYYDIQIYTPQEFIIEIDELLNIEGYSPALLRGVVSHSVSKIKNIELRECIDKFTAKNLKEKKNEFDNIVSSAISKTNARIKVIKKENQHLAFYSYEYFEKELVISFLRLAKHKNERTLFMQLISDFISKAIDKNIQKINLKESYLTDSQITILNKIGFENLTSISWVKHVCNKIIDKASLKDTLLNEIGLNIAEMDLFSIEDNKLLEIEHRLFPLKIWDIDIPCYVVPIKSIWAGQLFDYKISGETLFGAEPDKLWNIENVYFRHTRPITEIAPARILWYVSNDKNTIRSRAIVATSYLNEVMTDKPKVLYRNNKCYGIYEWRDIYDLCDKNIDQEIRALRFSKTEVFEYPIVYKDIQRVLKNNGRKENTFASPMKMDKKVFNQIYRLGKWKK